jgi:hypothetical protein
MKLFFCAVLFVFSGIASAEQSRTGSSASVQILWDYKDIPAGMKIYEVKGKAKLWKTESVKLESELPLAKEIPDATFSLPAGRSKRFALVYKNTTDKTQHFFAAPHSAEPPENSLGFKFKCLCVNHAYKVGPGETWYRIVEFKLSPAFSDKQLSVRHTLIGVSSEKAEAINSAPPVDANSHEM